MHRRLFCGLALLVLGCTTGEGRPIPGDASTVPPANDAGAPVPVPDAGPGVVMPPPPTGDEDALVYAHSSSTLFALDPRTLTVTRLGDFLDASGTPAPSMTDLAVRSDGVLYTCSFDTLFIASATDGTTEAVGDFDLPEGVRFNALTFVPGGVLGPTERLIGATAEGEIHAIDTETAATTLVATMGEGYGSSGDIVGIDGLGVFATVTREDRDQDILVQVDVATGEVTEVGSTGTIRLFGLGFFRDQLYGFNSFGWIYSIDPRTGAATVVERNTGADLFWGAGVTPRVVVDLI